MQQGTNTRRRIAAASGLATLAPLAALGAADHADAKRIVVKNTREHGRGSFNRAVRKANRTKKKDTILFASRLSGKIGTRGVKFPHPITLKSKSKHVRLVGEGNDPTLSLEGEDTISNPAKPSAVRGLRTKHIRIYAGEYVPVSISDVKLHGDGDGEGISTYFSELDLSHSTIRGFEYGVSNDNGHADIRNSVIADNDVGTVNYETGTTIHRSTITGNHKIGVWSGYYGGTGLHNSTVSDNDGWAFNGGVAAYGTTVADNEGVVDGYANYTVRFENSIIAGNNRSDGGKECVRARVKSDGGNVFAAGNCTADAGPGDKVVGTADLKPLADNGGPTPTRALRRRSPAINAANKDASKRDQRGVKRGKHPDSGAYERKGGRR